MIIDWRYDWPIAALAMGMMIAVAMAYRLIGGSYRRQRAVDQVLFLLLQDSREEFLRQLKNLGLIQSSRLSISGMMGTGIASPKVMARVLHRYLEYYPNNSEEVVKAVLLHFQEHTPWYRQAVPWFNSPHWAWGETRAFINLIVSHCERDDKLSIHILYSLLQAIDEHLLEERAAFAQKKKTKQLARQAAKAEKHWQLAQKVLEGQRDQREEVPSPPAKKVEVAP